MNAARWSLIVLLAAIGAGALTLSASSTLQLATTAGVEHVQVAAIAVLELASIVGTIMWLRATTTRGRIEAAVLVVGASFVTAIGGLGAYGLFGLVGPIFLVASVHVASQEWRKPATSPDQDNQDDQAWSGPATVELPRMPDTRPVEVALEPEPEPVRPQLESVGWSVDQIIADLRERGEVMNQRGIRRHYGVGAGKANKVLNELQTNEVAS